MLMQKIKLSRIFIFVVCFLQVSLFNSIASAQELVIRYAAHNYKGAPKFQISAFDEVQRSAVWLSEVITAQGGTDTEKHGGDRSLSWQTLTLKITPKSNISYFRVNFLNDYCCGSKKNEKIYGDRNFFVHSLMFGGDRYLAAKGSQKTCGKGTERPGRMFCNGALEIKIGKKVNPKEPDVTSEVKSVCGYTWDSSKKEIELKQLQRALSGLNLYAGAIDGVFGRGSCAALKRWAVCENIKSMYLNSSSLNRLIAGDASKLDPSCAVKNAAPLVSAPVASEGGVTVFAATPPAYTVRRSERATELVVDRDALAGQLSDANAEHERLEARIARSQQALGDANQTIARRSKRIEELEVARDVLAEQLQNARLEVERQTVRTRNLENAVEKLQRVEAVLAATTNDLAAAQAQIAELEARIAEPAIGDSGPTGGFDESQVAEIAAERAKLTAEVVVARSAAANRLKTVRAQEQQITTLKGQLKALFETDGSSSELARQLTAANGTLADQQALIATLREEAVNLQSENGRAQTLTLELEQVTSMAEDRVKQVNELEAELAKLEDADERAAELARQLNAANGTLADVYVRVAELEAKTALLSDAENRSAELQRQLNAANQTVAVKSDRINGLEAQTKQLQVGADRLPELERQLAGANGTIADLRENIQSDERVVAMRRSLEAANTTIADLRASIEDEYVSVNEYSELERQLAAAGSSIADLRDQIVEEYVSIEDHAELQRQLNGSNQTIADLRERIGTDYISSDEHEGQVVALNAQMDSLRAQLDATMTTIADLRDTIATDYVPIADIREAMRQLRALNGALVELQEANTVLRSRVIESDQLFANFREDCRANPDCSKAMRLD